MTVFFHGVSYRGYNRLLLIEDDNTIFSVCQHDKDFEVGEIVRNNHRYTILRFNSYIDQARDMHCRIRDQKEICYYAYHDLLAIKKSNIKRLDTYINSPFLVDCSTMAYNYFKREELYESKMNEFCYAYSFCDDL